MSGSENFAVVIPPWLRYGSSGSQVTGEVGVDAFPVLFLMLGVMVWFACGILGSFMAQEKGRSRRLGFFLGFVFGPFGLIRAATLLPDERGFTERGLRTGELRNCPECAEPIRHEARKCRFCGSEVQPTSNP